MGIEVEESVGEDPNRMDRWQQISGEGSEGSMQSGKNIRDEMGDQRRHQSCREFLVGF